MCGMLRDVCVRSVCCVHAMYVVCTFIIQLHIRTYVCMYDICVGNVYILL